MTTDRSQVVGRLALVLLVICALVGYFGEQLHHSNSKSETSNMERVHANEDHRALRIYDPKTTLPKVPHLVHFTIADDPPAHQMRVIEYSVKKAESHGFQVMIHKDKDAEALIYSTYPFLIPSWEILMNNKERKDIGARIGDFVRILLLHHYGGVYLDGDMIPCWDLTSLTNKAGVATFPLVNARAGQVLNSVMSGPARHPIWYIALDIMRNNPNLGTDHILHATGPALIANAVDRYFEMTKTPVIVPMAQDIGLPEPPPGEIWLQSGLVRFGAVERRMGPQTRGLGTTMKLGLVHLHWRTWITRGRVNSKYSDCDTNLDLIEIYLDHSCKHCEEYDNKRWSDCGKANSRHSGLIKED